MFKPEPRLSDMPKHIKQSIVNNSDTGTKLSLRQVDFKFKEIVENSKIHYQKLTLALRTDRVTVSWQKTEDETVEQTFKPKEDGFVMISDSFPVKTGKRDYRKAAVAKLFGVFKNSKVSVGELLLEVSNCDIGGRNVLYDHTEFKEDRRVIRKEIRRLLSLNNFRLKVTKLDIRFQLGDQLALSILPYLEPGTLEVLHIKFRLRTSQVYTQKQWVTDMITDTEQWRQLKEAEINAFTSNISSDKYSHLERFSLPLSRRPTDTMKTILEKMLRNPKLKTCCLGYVCGEGFDMTGAREYLKQFEKIPEFCRNGNYSFKHPYEKGKRVVIEMNNIVLGIDKYDY